MIRLNPLGSLLALTLILHALPASSSPLQSLRTPASPTETNELIESALDARQMLKQTDRPGKNRSPVLLASYSISPTQALLKHRGLGQNLPYGLPLAVASRITSPFGMRIHPLNQLFKLHKGVDLSARPGTPVLSTASGLVAEVDVLGHSHYGKYVVLRHSRGFSTRYAHLDEVKVRLGEQVEARQIIGLSGNTGTTNGPHLHYEVRYLGKPIDPQPFMKSAAKPQTSGGAGKPQPGDQPRQPS
ncbi:murein DD-endopeptidase MepM/ murein hydrolase activator NlpD [Pseudomonas sp. TE3786]